MKKIILSMAAISALAIAAPAAAQYSNNGYQNSNNGYQNDANASGNITDRIAQLRMRLQAGVQSGTITRQEAVPIRQQLQLLNRLERQYSVNGIRRPRAQRPPAADPQRAPAASRGRRRQPGALGPL
jgi:hypothetical protein